jgi:cutinase
MYTKTFLTLALASLATAGPVDKRQTRTTSKEFSQGGCRDVLFAWARGSTETGNMVSSPYELQLHYQSNVC